MKQTFHAALSHIQELFMNLVRHDNSTLFETKSSYYRAALKGLPCYAVVMNLIQPAEPFQTPCNCHA